MKAIGLFFLLPVWSVNLIALENAVQKGKALTEKVQHTVSLLEIKIQEREKLLQEIEKTISDLFSSKLATLYSQVFVSLPILPPKTPLPELVKTLLPKEKEAKEPLWKSTIYQEINVMPSLQMIHKAISKMATTKVDVEKKINFLFSKESEDKKNKVNQIFSEQEFLQLMEKVLQNIKEKQYTFKDTPLLQKLWKKPIKILENLGTELDTQNKEKLVNAWKNPQKRVEILWSKIPGKKRNNSEDEDKDNSEDEDKDNSEDEGTYNSEDEGTDNSEDEGTDNSEDEGTESNISKDKGTRSYISDSSILSDSSIQYGLTDKIEIFDIGVGKVRSDFAKAIQGICKQLDTLHEGQQQACENLEDNIKLLEKKPESQKEKSNCTIF